MSGQLKRGPVIALRWLSVSKRSSPLVFHVLWQSRCLREISNALTDRQSEGINKTCAEFEIEEGMLL
jgi:hypothetical protein